MYHDHDHCSLFTVNVNGPSLEYDMEGDYPRSLHEALSVTLQNAEPSIDWREVAVEVFGVKYQSWCSWTSGGERCRFPAEAVPPLCVLLRDFTLLDYLESQAGRRALLLPISSRGVRTPHLRDFLRRLLDDPTKNLDQKLLAKKLGISYRQLRYFVGPEQDRRLPAGLVLPLCRAINDFRLLDYLEANAGRLAFKKAIDHRPRATDITDFHQLLEESMEAVRTASISMRDDIVDELEAAAIVSELDTLIRHCLQLRCWLDGNRKDL